MKTMSEEKYITKAREVCQQYLNGEWSQCAAKQLNVQRLSLGKCNSLFICSLPDSAEIIEDEPRKVLVRFYGNEMTGEGNRYKHVGEAAEAVVFSILAQNNFGPQLFGVFNGGRIEEFIENRWLTLDELKDPGVIKVLATKVAQIHSLTMPVSKENKILEILQQMNKSKLDLKLDCSSLSEKNQSFYERLQTFDTELEVEFMVKVYRETKHKLVFCHHDLNRTNLLVDKRYSIESSDTRIMIIDYENCMYNYRGIDLGKFFSERALDGRSPGAEVEIEMPTEEEKEYFAREYLNEWRKISSNVDDNVDNVFNLTLEIDVGLLMVQIFTLIWNLVHPEVANDKYDFLENAYIRMRIYKQLKECFLLKYNHLS